MSPIASSWICVDVPMFGIRLMINTNHTLSSSPLSSEALPTPGGYHKFVLIAVKKSIIAALDTFKELK